MREVLTRICDTDIPWSPPSTEKFRITNTRISGGWLILTLRDANEKTHLIFFGDRDCERLRIFACRDHNRLLGNWLRMSDNGVQVDEADDRCLAYHPKNVRY